MRIWKADSSDRNEFVDQVRRIWQEAGRKLDCQAADAPLDMDRDWERLRSRMMRASGTDPRFASLAARRWTPPASA